MKRLPILAIAVLAAVAMAMVAGNALAKIQIKNVSKCVLERGMANDKVQVEFELYDDGTPTADTQGNADIKIDDVVVGTVRNGALPYVYSEKLAVAKKASHAGAIDYWGNANPAVQTIDPDIPDCVVGGIAEVAGAEAEALGATDSGGSSSATYAGIAVVAVGLIVLGTGGWYARRRWLS